jgi:ATP-dependent Clp protease ATP-binding subunit ClpA
VIQRSEQARRVLELAKDEAEGFSHRYLGPEHLVLGVLADGASGASRILDAHGIDLPAARAALARLADQGVVPAPRPSDAELLGTLGIDLDSVRHQTQQHFGAQAVGEVTWRVTRRRWWRGRRVVWTPLCGPPLIAKRALQLASQQAHALGHSEVRPEHLLLGLLEDGRQPTEEPTSSRRHREVIAHVGLPAGYHGAAGPLLAGLGIDLGRLQEAVTAELRGSLR